MIRSTSPVRTESMFGRWTLLAARVLAVLLAVSARPADADAVDGRLPWMRWQRLEGSEPCDPRYERCKPVVEGNQLVQTSRTQVRSKGSEKLLEKHLYLVATHFKVGCQLLRNTMHWTFDLLGATDSCQYGNSSRPVTSKPGYHEECTTHPTPIRFHNGISGREILKIRKEAASKGGLRGVMMIRDPLEIVVSGYCYTHRGAASGLPITPANITQMGPEEGVPAMASSLLNEVRTIALAYTVAKPDVLVVRFEKFTNSSRDFDNTMREILDFLFGNEITEKQKQEILNAVAVEDENRGLKGFSEDPKLNQGFNHTNDEADMAAARDALRFVPDDIMAELQLHREALGYT